MANEVVTRWQYCIGFPGCLPEDHGEGYDTIEGALDAVRSWIMGDDLSEDADRVEEILAELRYSGLEELDGGRLHVNVSDYQVYEKWTDYQEL